MKPRKFDRNTFVVITLIATVWVQISETLRYLLLVVPIMKSNAAPIPETTTVILVIWFCWGLLLTALTVFLFWMFAQIFGHTTGTIFCSATVSWGFFFVLYWVGTANMGLADWSILWVVLPLSWFELFIATYIASKLYQKPILHQTL